MDLTIMYELHINPYILTETQWITSYKGVLEIQKSRAEQQKKLKR